MDIEKSNDACEIQNTVSELMLRCGLGRLTADILPVSGGYTHRMYRVQTESGVYAVKHLNPEIMKRPDAPANYAKAERLEMRLERSGIPIVPALTFGGAKMQTAGGEHFYIFAWQEGSIADWYAISAKMCRAAGSILGRIHAIESIEPQSAPAVERHTDWHGFARRARAECRDIADVLEDSAELLIRAEAELSRAEALLPELCCISNEDMDPKNIMWQDGVPFVIDLECLDYGNPVSHAAQLALQWSGITVRALDTDKLLSFFEGYIGAYDNGFRAYDEVVGVAFTWVEWLEYNIRRALGECADATERALGISETLSTIGRIEYIDGNMPQIRAAMARLRDL